MVALKESRVRRPVSQLVRASGNNAKVAGSIPHGPVFFCTVQLFGREPSIQKMVCRKESRFRPPVSSVGWGAIDTENGGAGRRLDFVGPLAQLVRSVKA
ncbi:hypothetical protein TNIN_485431 [Trichonephila inaurata madagascariensis]|uniref:Uncharacterized protein n=1 Tax=Trichonephila inaurata madagascariensis TaxID=2747483 RepID=A0A8X6X604_9ARAC|nr:hypothetical protein TNIN_485431 [Trichonephila inaurata madagascariensis]